jgi:hypothetical protein
MSIDEYSTADNLGKLIKKSKIDVFNPDFDDKVMERIQFVHLNKRIGRNNIRWSWLFLIISILLMPLGVFALTSINFSESYFVINYLENADGFFLPNYYDLFFNNSVNTAR